MSAKLLYSLSDNKSNQQKPIGCMNGFLQFFDPHHLISSRSANNLNRRILPPDENRHQDGENEASKKPKGKKLKAIKTQGYSESSRISVSSSSASTTMSSIDYEWTVKNEKSLFGKNQPYSSPCQTNGEHRTHKKHNAPDIISSFPSPIKTAPKEQAARHAKKLNVDSPRLVSRSESFRSASSNQSVPILPLRKKNHNETVKDTPQFSCDISSLKLRDLPRLSLDSRQRTIKESIRESKDDLVLSHLRRETKNFRNAQNLPEEPASYRPPSNIVAKLMGLEALPDCSPSIKSQAEQDDSSICGGSDFLSRSSRIIDESKMRGVSHSPRNNCRESKTPRERKDILVIKPKPSPTVSKELSPEPHKNTLTVFAKIEERMNDLDFKRSGKDLRALKQILESINREKTKDTESRDTTPVRESNKEAVFAMQDLPLKSIHQVRIGKSGNGVKDPTQKKTTKHKTPMTKHSHGPSHKTHFTKQNNSGDRSPRPKTASKGQTLTKVNDPNQMKTSKTISTISNSEMKQHKSDKAGLRSQTETLRQKSYILKSTDDLSKVISTDSSFLGQDKHTNTYFSNMATMYNTVQPGMRKDTWQLSKNETAEEVPGDTSPDELAIVVREQPSPVSVLDANFYGDESPSPVKKKPTPFTDYETSATDTVPEWRDIGVTSRPNSLISSIEKKDIEVDNFSQTVQALRQLDYTPRRSPDSVESQEQVTLDKACVSEILAASGILDDTSFNKVNLQLDSKLFNLLEQTKGSRYVSLSKSTSKQDTIIGATESSRRKLLFDTVNEILSQKLSSTSLGSQPQFFKKKLAPTTDRRGVLQDIFTEINQIQTNSLNQSLDDENDFLIPIIQKDLAHPTGNWTDVRSEIPGLILDIERLIFKDLIAELVN